MGFCLYLGLRFGTENATLILIIILLIIILFFINFFLVIVVVFPPASIFSTSALFFSALIFIKDADVALLVIPTLHFRRVGQLWIGVLDA